MSYPRRLKKGDSLPEGAVMMTEEDVINMNQKRIDKWKPPLQAWPFKYGSEILGVATGICGLCITSHYRNILRLNFHAVPSTSVVGILLPALMSNFVHKYANQIPILRGDINCSICVETRSGVLQTLTGAAYPLICGPLMCVIAARKFHTYYIPQMQDKAEYIKMLRLTAPVKRLVGAMFMVQFAIGMFIAERELDFFENKFMSEDALSRKTISNDDITYV